jgi:hypothetical protein
MSLRIVDNRADLEAAWDVLGTTLKSWAGENNDAWQRDGVVDDARERGDMFWRREDVYLYQFRNDKNVGFGVSLTEKDRDLLQLEIRRGEPAKERRKIAVAVSESGEYHILVALDQLKRQSIRDALTRLPGVPAIKRATISNRDFILVGPLSDPRAPDALVALASLNPHFERHVEKLGKLLSENDEEEDEVDLYEISRRVRSQRRVQARVIDALFGKVRGMGYQLADTKVAEWEGMDEEARSMREREKKLIRADFIATRQTDSLVMEIKAECEREDVYKAIGQLSVYAAAGENRTRVLVLPAPRDPLGRALQPFEPAFAELDISVIMFDFKGNTVDFWMVRRGRRIPDDVASVFPIMS